jgi:hypothetical protein
MAKNPRLTQSPRALRSSTDDAEKYSKGVVNFEHFRRPDSKADPINAGAWKHQGQTVSRTWKPDV